MRDDSTKTVNQFKFFEPEIMEIPVTNGKYDANGIPEKCDKFAMGALAGWEMALELLRDQGFRGFQVGDYVTILCTGIQQSSDREMSDSPNFEVWISDSAPKQAA
jgi:hypothetical protein